VPARHGGIDRVESDGGRVTAVGLAAPLAGLAHDVGAAALGPDLELVGGGGTEGVRGAEQDSLSLGAIAVGQLGPVMRATPTTSIASPGLAKRRPARVLASTNGSRLKRSA
jgi:hypothetical protein